MTKPRNLIACCVCLIAMIAQLDLRAQSGIYDRIGIIPGHGAFGSLPEENIDLFTGNVTLSYRDLCLPGPNGLDVEVWRVYNSKILKDRQSGNPVVQAHHQSWVGMGWAMHMGMVHSFSSSAPAIEFPDGRLETAFPNNYGLGTNIYLTRDFLKYDKTYTPPFVYPKLYFKNGVIWTFGAEATIMRADGTSDPVRLVTRIENSYGHHIDIVYDPGLPTIQTITDSMGRVVTFVSAGSPKKLTQIRMTDANGNDRVFTYSVGNYANGYRRLDSFTPPLLPATTFEYSDGSSGQYELTRMTTSYGGVLEYSFGDHTFYFNSTALISRVVNQKRIIFNPSENPAIWNFTYPTYQGAATGAVGVDGPVYDTSFTYNAYSSSTPWKIGLLAADQAADGSFSDSYDWTYQQISNTNWTVLGVNMGTAKGPLPLSNITGRIGDATSRTECLYERTEVKRYGLPTRISTYIGSTGPLKTATYLVYYYEAHQGFKDRHLLDFVSHEEVSPGQGSLKRTDTLFCEELGKWGALKQVKRWKEGTTWYTWDYEYACDNPDLVTIKVDPPGLSEKQTVEYRRGVKASVVLPDFTTLTRTLYGDSSIASERYRDAGYKYYNYDNLGRIVTIGFAGSYNAIDHEWRPNGENRLVARQNKSGSQDIKNVKTSYWDGLGRDLGSTETGTDTALVLYSKRTLDAEGRVATESRGAVSDTHFYSYEYNAAGQLTRITDPLSKSTLITYQGTTKTVTDPEGHSTTYEYGDLPGLPTRVTDALGHAAVYTYDACGRLTSVVFNGARNHGYAYDGLDNVLAETHPETGSISYAYGNENLLNGKTWGGATVAFSYDASQRLFMTSSTAGGVSDIVTYSYNSRTGRVESIVAPWAGWSRTNMFYDAFGFLYSETVTVPGLGPKYFSYSHDLNFNPTGWTVQGNPASHVAVGYSSLNMPESVSYNGSSVVGSVSYGPNKMPASIGFGNSTVYSAAYNQAAMPTAVALTKNGTALYNASYLYDGAGNITNITSTSPALTASFGYDALNRLTSATYSSGPGPYSYEYDAYGNMLNVRRNGTFIFSKTYLTTNRINDSNFTYDDRGNLLSKGSGSLYYWDAQNRLRSIQTTSGAILGKYLYDDRGLRLYALPPLPEISIKHDAVDIPTGGDAYLSAAVGQMTTETLTIQNLGDANLTIGALTITGVNAADFAIVANPSPIVIPAGSTTFTVRFQPLSAGPRIALLTIPSNDIDEAQYQINLFGNYEPEIEITEAPNGGEWDFGEVEVGDYWNQSFTIHNYGDKELVLSGSPVVKLSGSGAGHFEIVNQPATPVAPGGISSFVVRFFPHNRGLKTATLSIANNDWNENPYEVTLTGTGIPPQNKLVEETAFTVISPVEGEVLVPGSAHPISWTGAKQVKEVKIDLSADNGTSFQTIAEGVPNSGSYTWVVPPAAAGLCLVRVSAMDGPETTGRNLSLDCKLKIPGSAADGSLLLRASLPDAVEGIAWTAELVFSAGPDKGRTGLRLNIAEGQSLENFPDHWHAVHVTLQFASLTASAWIDGEPVFVQIPLAKAPLAGPSAEFAAVSSIPAPVRIEDFQARYRDTFLRPETIGEEVSQRLAKDSFELYPTNTFPAEGGWRAAGAETSPTQEASQNLAAALVDDADSFLGLQSFRLQSDGMTGTIVSKQLSLPTRAPFGVSEGSFAIGVAVTASEASLTPRNMPGSEAAGGKDTDPPSGTPVSAPSSAGLSPLSASPLGNYYVYSFDGKLLQVYDVYGTLLKDYIYMGERMIAEYDHVGSRLLYYTPDQINSTRVVTDQAGNVVYSAVHDPYGGIQLTGQNNTYDPQLKFSGKERDVESEFDYFGARYYDRSQYRFISVDPALDEYLYGIDNRRWNLYAYCVNNPIIYIDPYGEAAVIFDRATNRIAIIQGNGQLWDWFPASNNVGAGVSAWPQGQYRFIYWAPPENAGYYGWDFDSIDGYGAYVFDVNGRSGMSIHSGMVGVYDNARHYGWECWTAGCIRTVQDVMIAFSYLESMSDRVTDLLVFDDFKKTISAFSVIIGVALNAVGI